MRFYKRLVSSKRNDLRALISGADKLILRAGGLVVRAIVVMVSRGLPNLFAVIPSPLTSHRIVCLPLRFVILSCDYTSSLFLVIGTPVRYI